MSALLPRRGRGGRFGELFLLGEVEVWVLKTLDDPADSEIVWPDVVRGPAFLKSGKLGIGS